MIFLKKFLIYIRLFWYGLFHGFKNVDDLITKNQKNVDDFTIEINNVGDSIYKDMLEEKETQEIKELVYTSYKVAQESKNYRYIGDIGDGYVVKKEIPTSGLSNTPTNIENSDNKKIIVIQDNFNIVKGINESLNNNTDVTYKLKITRDLFPRFIIESYIKKIVIKENDENYIIDLYCSKYPRQFSERKDKSFLREICNIKDGKIRNSDVLDFSGFSFITENAWGKNDLIKILITEIKFDKIIEYNGNYVIRFFGNYSEHNLLDKVYCESAEEKYQNKTAKPNNSINFTLANNNK